MLEANIRSIVGLSLNSVILTLPPGLPVDVQDIVYVLPLSHFSPPLGETKVILLLIADIARARAHSVP